MSASGQALPARERAYGRLIRSDHSGFGICWQLLGRQSEQRCQQAGVRAIRPAVPEIVAG